VILKFFIDYPYVVYSIFTWGFIFIFLGFKEIKRLWPISILSAIMIFIAVFWLVAAGLYKISINFLPVFGIPFFFILWGAANGIVYAHYFGEKIYQRFLAILIFAGITVGFESLVEYYKRVQHLGKFNDIIEFVFDAIILSALSFIMTSLFGNRLTREKKDS
jgi:hypothetical protein